jgi:hypothetical protein
MGEKRNLYKVLILRPEGKVPLGRPRHRLKDNFKIDVREIAKSWTGFNYVAEHKVHWQGFCQ